MAARVISARTSSGPPFVTETRGASGLGISDPLVPVRSRDDIQTREGEDGGGRRGIWVVRPGNRVVGVGSLCVVRTTDTA